MYTRFGKQLKRVFLCLGMTGVAELSKQLAGRSINAAKAVGPFFIAPERLHA
jgi:hypothetical protein